MKHIAADCSAPCTTQPGMWLAKLTADEANGRQGYWFLETVKENGVIPVEGFVAAEKREAVEVRSGAGERDGRALTAAELSPVSEPPAVLKMCKRTHRNPSRESPCVPRSIRGTWKTRQPQTRLAEPEICCRRPRGNLWHGTITFA